MTPAEERLRARLSADLRTAMKAHEAVRISALRSMLAALDNASAVDLASASPPPPFATSAEVPRRELSAQEVANLLAREITQRQQAALKMRALDRAAAADRALAEAELLETYVDAAGR